MQDCAMLVSFEVAAQVVALTSAVLPERVSSVTWVLMAFRIPSEWFHRPESDRVDNSIGLVQGLFEGVGFRV